MLSLAFHDRLLCGSCLTMTLTKAQPNITKPKDTQSVMTPREQFKSVVLLLGTLLGPAAQPKMVVTVRTLGPLGLGPTALRGPQGPWIPLASIQ